MPPQETKKLKPHDRWYSKPENKEIAKRRAKEWRIKNYQHDKERKAKYRKEHPEVKQAQILRQYGLTIKQYEQMLVAQGYACAICKCISDKRLHVDHNHDTGKVRGLLCARCNLGIGGFEDKVDLLLSAIKYLSSN